MTVAVQAPALGVGLARGYNPGFGFLDDRHRVPAVVLSRRNTVTLTLTARLLGRDRNTLSYHAHRTMPLPAFAAPDVAAVLAQPRRTHPPRTIEALQSATAEHECNIKSGSSWLTAPHQRVSPAKYFAAFHRISRSSSSSRTFSRRAAFSCFQRRGRLHRRLRPAPPRPVRPGPVPSSAASPD
ncbi:hypothetical protein [Streptomyces sp. NPDC002619]|uniref:hypothetical protein n=1 Tax=Streptomyces sp. NPDC002619 TaxID=3364655 RepID=UPI00369CF78C